MKIKVNFQIDEWAFRPAADCHLRKRPVTAVKSPRRPLARRRCGKRAGWNA